LFLLAVGYLIIAFGVQGVEGAAKTSMFWLLSMYLVHTMGELCLSPIGLSMVARLSPIRLGSLLMGIWFMSNAMANDFAGMLSKLYPEKMVSVEQVVSSETKYNLVLVDKSKKDNKTIENTEKVNNVISLPISAVKFDKIKDSKVKQSIYEDLAGNAQAKEKSFLGIRVNSLYSFFMVFVVMAGVAAVILFLLSSKLLKMMDGIR
jgi:POT family proton-dependent oligopeptide transporter